MPSKRDPKHLAKFLAYLLGHHPEEFGLVPDADGYVRVKTLLAACSEEPGYAHVRQRDLEAVSLIVSPSPIDIDGNRIRARDRQHLVLPQPADDPPTILWLPIRRRAHARVAKHGSQASGGAWLTLTGDSEMAERLGKRLDRQYVSVTVNTDQAMTAGVVFYHAGGPLYIADWVPPSAMTVPPVPEPKEAPRTAAEPRPTKPFTPGSIILDSLPDPAAAQAKQERKRRKDPEWKRHRKRRNRNE